MTNYIVATIKPWNRDAFYKYTPALPGVWHLAESPEALQELLEKHDPKYIFFPHWSWRVPAEMLSRWECVCFHMTDLPYGRGGSPLQNLIAAGHQETRLTALRMVEKLDAGPIYGKLQLSLEGRAQNIFERAAELIYTLVGTIVNEQPEPQPQTGEVVKFKRRRPEQSELPITENSQALHDHIRMLDATGYPPAFIEHGPWRIEFSHAEQNGDSLAGRFSMRLKSDETK